ERALREEEDRARKVLSEHRAGLEAVAHALLVEETLDGDEVARLVDEAMGHKAGGPRKVTRADGTEVDAEELPEGDSLSDVDDTVGAPTNPFRAAWARAPSSTGPAPARVSSRAPGPRRRRPRDRWR